MAQEVCDGNSMLGQPVSCKYSKTSTQDIGLNIQDANIETSNSDDRSGVLSLHKGEGNVQIEFISGEIQTNFDSNEHQTVVPHGIIGWHEGIGTVHIAVTDAVIDTVGENSRGIYGGVGHYGPRPVDVNQREFALSREFTRDITMEITNADITTKGEGALGIAAWHRTEGNSSLGNIKIVLRDGEIKTSGVNAIGLSGTHQSNGEIIIDIKNLKIRTEGERNASGIFANAQKSCPNNLTDEKCSGTGTGGIRIIAEGLDLETSGSEANNGVLAWNRNRKGPVEIILFDSNITTQSKRGNGILGIQSNDSSGNIKIDLRDSTIETRSTESFMQGNINYGTIAHGVLAQLLTEGEISISVNGGTIVTHGTNSHGIYGQHRGTGNISIAAGKNHKITTNGAGSYGIYALHLGTGDNRGIEITTGNIEARGVGSVGARIGRLTADRLAQFVASFDENGFRRNVVTINGKISAETGVFLAGGGRINFETTGSVDASSGAAILATGDNSGLNPGDSPTKPKLHISINLNGRPIAEIIGEEGWIINDGGGTTIVVNGIKLHDSINGVVPDAVVTDGNRAYRIRADGVRIIDRTTDTWVISERAEGIIVDRDFSVADFVWEEVPTAPPEDGSPDLPGIVLVNVLGIGLYEVVPNFMLRLNKQEFRGKRIWSSSSPIWVRLAKKSWTYQPTVATVDGEYRASNFTIETGIDLPLSDSLVSSASVSRVEGLADVATSREGGVKYLPMVLG